MNAITTSDALGDRMKGYEHAARSVLPARTFQAIRLDGRAFHTWVRGLERPYSLRMVEAMGEAMLGLCEQIPNVLCGFQQSDELTLITYDFIRPETQPWYGGQTQKIVSVAASMMTVLFGRHFPDRAPAFFDARVFALPNRIEVANNLYWRYIDGTRNAISMVASANFSARELHGVSTEGRLEMLRERGVEMSDLDPRFVSGQFAKQHERLRTSYTDRRSGETVMLPEPAISREWRIGPAPALNAQPEGILLSEILPADAEMFERQA